MPQTLIEILQAPDVPDPAGPPMPGMLSALGRRLPGVSLGAEEAEEVARRLERGGRVRYALKARRVYGEDLPESGIPDSGKRRVPMTSAYLLSLDGAPVALVVAPGVADRAGLVEDPCHNRVEVLDAAGLVEVAREVVRAQFAARSAAVERAAAGRGHREALRETPLDAPPGAWGDGRMRPGEVVIGRVAPGETYVTRPEVGAPSLRR